MALKIEKPNEYVVILSLQTVRAHILNISFFKEGKHLYLYYYVIFADEIFVT